MDIHQNPMCTVTRLLVVGNVPWGLFLDTAYVLTTLLRNAFCLALDGE